MSAKVHAYYLSTTKIVEVPFNLITHSHLMKSKILINAHDFQTLVITQNSLFKQNIPINWATKRFCYGLHCHMQVRKQSTQYHIKNVAYKKC